MFLKAICGWCKREQLAKIMDEEAVYEMRSRGWREPVDIFVIIDHESEPGKNCVGCGSVPEKLIEPYLVRR